MSKFFPQNRRYFCKKFLGYVSLGVVVSLTIFWLSFQPIEKGLAQDNGLNLLNFNSETLKIIKSPPTFVGNIDIDFVKLDGRKLFLVTALAVYPENQSSKEIDIPLQQRIQEIEQGLLNLVNQDFDPDILQVTAQIRNGLPVIYVNDQYLLTLTDQDAEIYGLQPEQWAEELIIILKNGLIRAHQERQPKFLQQQGRFAGVIAFTTWGLSLGLWRFKQRLESRSHDDNLSQTQTVESSPTQETQPQNLEVKEIVKAQSQAVTQQQRSLQEVKRRLLQGGQLLIWGSGLYGILGLFPYTRSLQFVMVTIVQIPCQLLIIGLGTYIAIRLSWVIISRVMWEIKDSQFLTPEASQRLVLRVSTFSQVLKRIIALALTISGILIALSVMGIPVGPILAGAGIFGLAISFASQSVIKDAINGILILLEDQYGVGDSIAVGTFQGLVENMDLRITQLRNAEGALITIPNGEIRAVKNLSKEWSRVDLNLFVDYNANLNQAMELIENTALEMSQDIAWKNLILEPPQLLGVEDFSNRGVVIKIWIKTQPLKQWEVARNYRHRLKAAFDHAGITIALPQQKLSFATQNSQHSTTLKAEVDNV